MERLAAAAVGAHRTDGNTAAAPPLQRALTTSGGRYPGSMFPGILPRPMRVVGVLALLAAVGAGLWLWDRAGSSTIVSEDAAVRDFRRDARADPSGARAGVPREGVYTFSQSGSERGGAGPVGVTRGLPARARYVVTHTGGGYREELRLSEEHLEAVTLRVGPRATREMSRRTEVTFLGFGRDDRRDLRPPPTRLVWPLTVGRRWESRYTAGSLPVATRSAVVRSEVVVVDGRRHATRLVRTVGDTGGAHPGRRVDLIWWSPALALPLRWHIDMDIGGPVTLRTRARLTIESVEPRV